MLKSQELRFQAMMDRIDKNNELHVKHKSESFNHELKVFRSVAKERHILFVEAVKKVREDVNFKLEEIRSAMEIEVAEFAHNYSSLHNKVDIIVAVVTKVVESYTS